MVYYHRYRPYEYVMESEEIPPQKEKRVNEFPLEKRVLEFIISICTNVSQNVNFLKGFDSSPLLNAIN